MPRALPIIAMLVALPLLMLRIALRLTREHRDRSDAVSAEQRSSSGREMAASRSSPPCCRTPRAATCRSRSSTTRRATRRNAGPHRGAVVLTGQDHGTAGEGGAVTTGDAWLARPCWELKDHGKSYAAVYEQEHARR